MTQEEFFKRYSYNIRTDRIGGGGFGTVYKAHDRTLHREVAIKVSEVKVAANGKSFSLKDEFNALQHLPKHPNIANYEELYSFDMPNGFFDYAVMQYYPDGNLSNLIGKSLTFEQKEDIALQLLKGVAFLHEHKVVHRDLKPGNILIVRYGEEICPLITDFGLSKTADMDDHNMFSNSFGGGTERYSSPEQLQGLPLRMNTDLWSYGAVVYELFAEQPLFEAGSNAANSAQADLEIYNKIIHGDTENRLENVPEKWRKIMERCLVVDPEKRAKSAEELLEILREHSDDDDKVISNEIENEPEEDYTIVDYTKPSKEDTSDPLPPAHTSPTLPPKSDRKMWITLLSIFVGIMAIGITATIIVKSVKNKAKAEVKALAQTYTVKDVSFTMIYVEGGTFQMGSTPDQGSDTIADEKPVHSVTVSDFCIGETEVTQALWKAVMGRNPSSFKGDKLPVDNVSWNECQEFIKKLNALTNKTFRLPTEAEWEYAARGGNHKSQYKYSGSNNLSDVAWYSDNSGAKTHPVKGKKPNELKLYDMSGNVWEWCEDIYGSYTNSAETNPQGCTSGTNRVLRGGSWRNTKGCRVANRNANVPGNHSNNHGFRLVLMKKNKS